MENLAFPIAVEKLSRFLPHRKPALWIDEVLWAKPDEGECRVYLKKDSRFYQDGRLRSVCFIEWIAQAFGFVSAAQEQKAAQKAFLVAIKDAVYNPELINPESEQWKSLRVHVKKTYQMGPIGIIEGRVLKEDGSELAKAQLKLFAE